MYNLFKQWKPMKGTKSHRQIESKIITTTLGSTFAAPDTKRKKSFSNIGDTTTTSAKSKNKFNYVSAKKNKQIQIKST